MLQAHSTAFAMEILVPFLQLTLSYIRCLGQGNPCEGISLGSCDVEPDSIIKTYTATPDRWVKLWKIGKIKAETSSSRYLSLQYACLGRCSKLCEMNDNCEYWRAQWDGQLCHLLSSDYQHVSTTGTILYETFSRIVNPLLEPSTGWTALKDQSLAMPLWRMTVSTVERE